MRPVANASLPRRVAGLALIAVIAGGCASTAQQEGAQIETVTTTTAVESAPASLVVDVNIRGGEASPTNERLDARVGETITVRVTSDAADELHVHSVPEHSFAIEPAAAQEFRFTVDVPGQVSLELHDLGKTVATLRVRP